MAAALERSSDGDSRQRAEAAWLEALRVIREAVIAGYPVTLLNVGTLLPTWRKARNAYNPAAREHMHVGPRRLLKFRVSRDLRNLFRDMGEA